MGVADNSHVGMYGLLGAAGFLGGLMRMSAAQARVRLAGSLRNTTGQPLTAGLCSLRTCFFAGTPGPVYMRTSETHQCHSLRTTHADITSPGSQQLEVVAPHTPQALILMEMTSAPAQLPFLMFTLVLSKNVGDHFNYSVFDHQMMLKGLAFVGIDENKAKKSRLNVRAPRTAAAAAYLAGLGNWQPLYHADHPMRAVTHSITRVLTHSLTHSLISPPTQAAAACSRNALSGLRCANVPVHRHVT